MIGVAELIERERAALKILDETVIVGGEGHVVCTYVQTYHIPVWMANADDRMGSCAYSEER